MKLRGLIAALLCGCLSLAGCGGREAAPADGADPGPTGRYVEQTADFPALAEVLAFQEVAPDRYYLLGVDGDEETVVWRTDDGARTWEEIPAPGLTDWGAVNAAFAPDGSFYINYVAESTEEVLRMGTALVRGETVTPLEGLPEDYNWGMELTASGALLLDSAFSVIRVDPQTGAAREMDLERGQLFFGSYVVFDETLAACAGDCILLLNTETGGLEALELAQETGYGTVLALQADRSAFFYCNSGGLYRVTMDGAITEQLIDGTLTTMGMPAVYPYKLLTPTDGSFLVLFTEEGRFQLLRYEYQPDLPREPTAQLSVYSLRDNGYLRQVIGLYQREHPDIMVRLEIGMPDGTAVTAEDAARTLATRMLAGDGPDLLLLDGLPLEGYVRGGALLDLEAALDGTLADLLPGPVEAYRSEELLWAAPTRVTMPVLAGIGVEGIGSLGDLAAYLENQDPLRFSLQDEWLLELFEEVCAPGWVQADGTLNTEALAADLEALQALAELARSSQVGRWGGSLPYQSLFWSGEGASVILGSLENLEDLSELYTAFQMREGGSLYPFPATGRGVVVPGSVLGVNAAGRQTEAAVDFVRFALQPGVQASTSQGGLPVSRAALEEISTRKEPGQGHSSFGSGFNDTGEHYWMYSLWPEREQMALAIGMLNDAPAAAHRNEVVTGMILDEAQGLLQGAATPDQAVRTVTQKVERYLQEQLSG